MRSEGFTVIDADQLARRAVEKGSPGLKDLAANFGPDVLLEDGCLNRPKLRELVFEDPAKRQRLEALLHPEIQRLLEAELAKLGLLSQPQFWFYEAALLFETGSYQRFHAIWACWCPYPSQLARLMARSALSQQEAEALIRSQWPAGEKKARADLVIDTSGPIAAVQEAVKTALKQTGLL